MRFDVDPWDPTYGPGADTEEMDGSTARVELDVELPAERWRPIDPDPALAPPPVVLFVDGVRRVDASVWIRPPAGSAEARSAHLGVCATYAAGVVRCGADGADLVTAEVRRGLFTTAPHATDIDTAAGRYQVRHARAGETEAVRLNLALQRDLAAVELAAASQARTTLPAPGGSDLLVVDGPLQGREHLPRAVGFVKSHRSEYLPPRTHGVVGLLTAGQRTPVFRIGTRWNRLTWYLRLPCLPGAPWAGIARVECRPDLPVEDAVHQANLSQVTLPRYASAEHKDPRAPQNLYPIAGLERLLRRRLGEPGLLYRALRTAAA